MGNHLTELSTGISLLDNLKELKIEGNAMKSLPPSLNEMESLERVICEDNLIDSLDPLRRVWRKENGIFRRQQNVPLDHGCIRRDDRDVS